MFATLMRPSRGRCGRQSCRALLVLCAAALLAASGFAGDITTGLVAYYKLNENSGLIASDSSGTNTGTLQNFPASPWVVGQVNGGLQLDGVDDFVNVPDAPSLRLPGDMTLAFWMYKTSDPANWSRIVGKGVWPYRNYTLWDFPGADGHLHFSMNDNFAGGTQPATCNSNAQIPPGEWHHIVCMRSGSTTSIYIDGLFDASVISAVPQGVNADPLTFGIEAPGGTAFPGVLDEVRLYNRALSAADIQDLFAFRDVPAVVSAIATNTTQVDLTFNTAVEAASANTAANYSINGGVTVASAVRQADPKTVRLTVAGMLPQVFYTLNVANIRNTTVPLLTMVPQQMSLLVDATLLDSQITAHFQFEETGGTQADDSTGRNNHGQLRDGAVRGTGKNGTLAQGLVLDGNNDRVEGTSAAPFKFNGGNMALSLWCNITAAENDNGYLISKPWNGSGEYNYWLRVLNTGRIEFRLQGATAFAITSPGAISTAAWHHIVGTVDAARNMALYIDGVLVASAVHTVVSWVTASGDINIVPCIGSLYPYGPGWAGNNTFSIAGTLDDVRFYGRVLSGPEITSLFRDLPAITITATDTSANETGTDPGTFRIARTGSTANPLTVQLTQSGTATLGVDYNLNGGAVTTSVVIPAGQLFVDVTVTGLNDPNGEPTETVILTVAADLANYNRVIPLSATVNLTDDEAIITVLALQPNASERGPQQGAFLLTRSNNTVGPLTVSFTLTGTTVNGADYQTLPLIVNFAAGQTTATIFVDPIGDGLVEGDETVILTVTTGVGQYAPPATSTATVTIGDRSVVTLQASDPDAYEVGVNPGVITVTRTAPLDVALTVPYTITGSAIAGTDYVTLSGSVTFDVGASTAAITIIPIDDAILGLDSIVTISIAGTAEYAVGTPTLASVTIHTDPEIFSGSGGISMTPNPALAGQQVTFSGSSGGATVVNWLWSYGDGGTGTGQQATHTYAHPGEYDVTVSATLADGTATSGTRLLFVGTAVDGAVAGAGAVVPGGGGLMLGGSGITKQAGGKLRIRFSRRQVTLSAKLGNLMFDRSLGQFALQGRQGWLTIGPEANHRTYFFVLDAKGSGTSAEVPKMLVSLKKRAIGFTVVEPELTEFLGTLGASRTAPQTVLNLPITVRVADKIFVAFTLVMDFKAHDDNGAGTLRKK